jgi:hypothetical protein
MTTNREAVISAIDAWDAAEKAYRDESAQYWAAAWAGDPVEQPEKVLTPEALVGLRRLREAAPDAQTHYEKVRG